MKTPESDATKSVKLVCEPPVQLSSTPTAVCFVLPAGLVTKGFSLCVNDDLFGQMTLSGTPGKNTILRSACRTATQVFDYSIMAVNPETTLRGIAVSYEDAASVMLPLVTGTNNAWKVYWGDGASDDYSPVLTHTYADPAAKVAVFYSFQNADQIVFQSLGGINTVYVNKL